MRSEQLDGALAVMFPLIAIRLSEAHSIASAANACVSTGNYDGAFRILLDIEQHLYEAKGLLNTASILRREQKV
jgi:hypothetical protein